MTTQEAIDRLAAMRHSFLSSGGLKAASALTLAIEVLQERATEEARAKDICRPPMLPPVDRENSLTEAIDDIWNAGLKDWEKVANPDGLLKEIRGAD